MRRVDSQPVKSNADHRVVLGYLLTAAICALGLSVVAGIKPFVTHYLQPDHYIPIHMVLEFISIVVSFAVFAMGWYGYRQTRNRQDLFIAVAFMVVGALDFVHTLSYKGMPDFLGTNTVGKAAAYWLAARLVSAASLLGAAFISRNSRSRWTRPGFLVPVAVVVVASLIGFISEYEETASNLMYRDGALTSLKVVLEYTVVALCIAAFWALGSTHRWRSDSVRQLKGALILIIGSEICFTLYRNAYDAFNLLGHIYKVAAYYLVLHALFVSSLRWPYLELSRTKHQLQKSFRSIGEALAAGLHKDSTLNLIVSLARQMFNADFAAIGEVKTIGTVDIQAFDGLNSGPISVPVQDSLSGEAFVTGKPVVVSDLRSHPKARPEFVRLGLRSFVSAPIMHDSRPAGAIYICSTQPGVFTDEDADILTAFAGHAAIAIANAEHYEREHHIAESLQQVIFPPAKLEFGSLRIAGKYEPAWDEARVGGDFFDYFDLGDGRLGIAIGDVSGKGLDAAVHTAIVKYSYQAYLREGFSPSEALRRIDEAFHERARQESFPDHVFISLFCGILEESTGRLTYCNAGHEPPVKLSKSGDTMLLNSTAPIIGLNPAAQIDQSEITVEPGDVLVLYTDGVTEARWEGDMFGSNGLIDAIRGCNDYSPEDLAEHLYQKAKTHARGLVQDDIAIVIVQR